VGRRYVRRSSHSLHRYAGAIHPYIPEQKGLISKLKGRRAEAKTFWF
jgi:hypothetical protein